MPEADDKYTSQRSKVNPPHVGLAALRKSHEMTQKSVAELVTEMTGEPYYSGSLSLLEGGHRGASEPVLRALEQIFNLDPGDLRVDYEPTHSRRKLEAAS